MTGMTGQQRTQAFKCSAWADSAAATFNFAMKTCPAHYLDISTKLKDSDHIGHSWRKAVDLASTALKEIEYLEGQLLKRVGLPFNKTSRDDRTYGPPPWEDDETYIDRVYGD